MISSDNIILVLGATGQQGGSVLTKLVAAGWKVQALTRNKNTEKAKLLDQKNAEVVIGDLENKLTLDNVMKDVYGVFSVQPFEQPVDIGKEIQMGINVAMASKEGKTKI
jgi:uncharacterized protein YbjT (DUF2867 family)